MVDVAASYIHAVTIPLIFILGRLQDSGDVSVIDFEPLASAVPQSEVSESNDYSVDFPVEIVALINEKALNYFRSLRISYAIILILKKVPLTVLINCSCSIIIESLTRPYYLFHIFWG